MRCPKCQYIGFDTGAKCRNCGYDFSLSAAAPTPARDDSLPIRIDAADGPLADLPLFGTPPGGQTPTPASPVYFKNATPLVSASATPRPPLAVRRATPDAARLRARVARARAQEPELDLLLPAAAPDSGEAVESDYEARPAGRLRRLAAGFLDTALMLALDLIVLSLTLKLCGLRAADLAVLPLAPLGGFFLLLNGGYWVSFTAAGGQTLGKMLTGIRVTSDDAGPVGFGTAVVRTAGYALSALPAGLGFLPALVSADRRALHDRLAATRVIDV